MSVKAMRPREAQAMKPSVLLKFGEIVLKGRNRALFYAQLRRNVVRTMTGA